MLSTTFERSFQNSLRMNYCQTLRQVARLPPGDLYHKSIHSDIQGCSRVALDSTTKFMNCILMVCNRSCHLALLNVHVCVLVYVLIWLLKKETHEANPAIGVFYFIFFAWNVVVFKVLMCKTCIYFASAWIRCVPKVGFSSDLITTMTALCWII